MNQVHALHDQHRIVQPLRLKQRRTLPPERGGRRKFVESACATRTLSGAFKPADPIEARFHRADATEETDSIQNFSATRMLGTALTESRTQDYRGNHLLIGADSVEGAVEGTSSTSSALGIVHQCGQYAFESGEQGSRLARHHAQALACRQHGIAGRGTVRQLAVGRTLHLLNHPSGAPDGRENSDGDTLITRIDHRFRSNIAKAQKVIANTTDEAVYANHFQGVPARLTYRAITRDGYGGQLLPKPTIVGTITGMVVGVSGNPIHADRDGRVKVQFHFLRGSQSMHRLANASGDDAPASDASYAWVRVLTPLAGANYGGVFTPRLGMEVLIGFVGGDIDRPVVLGAVYNGRGVDNAQGNQVAAGGSRATGNAPAFFPGTKSVNSAEGNLPGHNHAAVIVGIKTQELRASQTGLSGFNAALADCTPSNARFWLGTTQAQSHLVAGYLRHQNDNQLLQARGYGATVETQAYGAIRAGSGLLISADARLNGSSHQLDSKEAEAQLQTALELAQTLADTAQQHNAKLPNEPAPDKMKWRTRVDATIKSLQGTETGSSGAANDDGSGFVKTQGGGGTVTAYLRPDLIASSPAGIGLFTPASHVSIAGNTFSLIAGHDINTSSARTTAFVVAKGICLFTYGKAQNPNKPNTETGIKLHAASGSHYTSALTDEVKITADKAITLDSVTSSATFSAPASKVLATGGGSYFTLDKNIEIGSPGTVTFNAAMKSLTSAASASGSASLPKPGNLKLCEFKASQASANHGVGVPVRA